VKLVLSCEHAFNTIPKEYECLFVDVEETLKSHRAYDPGALDVFKKLEVLADFSQVQNISRLLVEVNRSKNHPHLFSEFSKNLSREEKTKIFKKHYFPYRDAVENKILAFIEEGEKVLHFSVHTFTPELNGHIRNTDIGLLYDPARAYEKEFSENFKRNLKNQDPDLKLRFNYPYLGKADGFTTYLRNMFPENYMGIELEVNQKFVRNNKMNFGVENSLFSALKLSKK
jgi:predicted N-formylglutamate amidohydrolase